MNGTAHRAGHLTLVPTPTAAELARLVALDEPAVRRPAPLRPAPLRPAPLGPALLGPAPLGPAPLGPTPLRLTRRGRVAVVAVFLLALVGGGVLFGTGSRAGASDQAGPAHAYLVVQPGQTLWSIAKAVAPQDDPRATIEAIRRLNSLPDTGIQAGQRIALP